ncbi:MAG: hypothetical protein ACLR06_14970 [Christensenellaceae bacterium]
MKPFIEEDSVLLCGDDLIQNGSWTEKGLALIAAIEVGAITDKKGCTIQRYSINFGINSRTYGLKMDIKKLPKASAILTMEIQKETFDFNSSFWCSS